jgi:hypothetical protein
MLWPTAQCCCAWILVMHGQPLRTAACCVSLFSSLLYRTAITVWLPAILLHAVVHYLAPWYAQRNTNISDKMWWLVRALQLFALLGVLR